MKTPFWTPYISDHTIKAICWTLIHSLWIGLAIALLSGLVISITRKSSAALRYNLLCGILVLFTLSVWITFYIEMNTSAIEHGPFRVGQFILAPDNHIMVIPATGAPQLSLFSRMMWLFNEYSNIIFLTWLLLFVLKSLKMAGGLLYIQRIRSYKVHDVSDEFKHKIEMFSRQIGIRRAVRLVQSELVKVPVAVGWLKPMILLPMGILLQLPPEQLESILWHELAHIRRRDFLVNILQGLVETVFFFNPGLLWLSSLIRTEREACCDDMVLSRMNRKANYLEALLAFGYEDNSRLSLAMGIGSGNQLRDRLKRMVSQENKRLSVAEKVVLAAGLVLLSAFTTMPKTTIRAAQNLINVMIKKPGNADPVKSTIITTDSATKQTRMFRQTDVMSSDTLHSKMDTTIRFRSVLFKRSDSDLTNNDISAMSDAGRKYHFIVANNKLVAMDIDGEKVKDSDLPNYQYMITQIDVAVLEKRHVRELDIARFKTNNPAVKFKADRGFDKKRYADSIRFKSFKGDFKGDAMRERWRGDSINYAGQKDRALNVIADLVHDKAVPDLTSVKWFGLSNTEFIVNGKKQPGEMQQKYKAKYGIYEGNGLYYGPVQMHGVGVFIDITDPMPPPLPPRGPRPPKTPRELRSGYVKPKYTDTNERVVPASSAQKREEMKRLQQLDQQRLSLYDQQREEVKRLQRLDEQRRYSSEQALKMLQRAGQFGELYKGPRIPLQDIMASITDDLVSANVLSNKSGLVKFNLTNSALMVNGIKQPEELHQKLKAKYLEKPDYKINSDFAAKPNFGLHFNAQSGAIGLGVTDGPDSP